MPVSTRQATPGPSTLAPTALQPSNQPKNTKKRPNSDTQEDGGREVKKKIKIATEATPKSPNGNEKKRKRRKKKKRTSVVTPDPQTEERTRPAQRSAPLSSSNQAVTSSGGSALDSQPMIHVQENEENEEAILSSSDKGKGKAKSKSESPPRRATKSPSVQPIASGSGSTVASPTDSTVQDSEIARLKEQLAVQTKLLERHETHIGHHHQSLTCQICLELMYKPYALAPCGHITCYGCLVRWFTAPPNPAIVIPEMNGVEPAAQPDTIENILNSFPARNGSYIRRRKKCPICRAVIVERPVEMWGIKDMVSALVRSNLVDIPPAPEPAGEEGANADPWRNVFRRAGAAHGGHFAPFLPFAAPAPRDQDDEDREQMGWYDAEDGGIHRCIDCYHEIWDGICSGCQREYPGHGLHNDDDEDDDDDGSEIADFLPFGYGMDIFSTDDESGHEDGDVVYGYEHPDGWGFEYGLQHASDDEDEDEVMEVQEIPRANPLLQFMPARRGGRLRERGIAQVVEVSDDDDDDEESDYGGSFIDDNEHGDRDNHNDDENDEDSDDEVEFVEPPRSRGRVPARRIRYEETEEEEDDDDDEDEDVQGILFESRTGQSNDGSDDESGEEQYRHYQRPLRRHVQHHRHIVQESDSDGGGSHGDDDDDDDDDDVVFQYRYHRRAVPVVDWRWQEEDDDEEDDGGWD